MDLQPHSEPEFTVVSTTNHAESAPYSGAFFSHATGFTIRGGEFTSNVTNHFHTPSEEEFSAFELIRLGNIILRKEFKEMRIDNQSGMVGRQSRGTSVRRVYTAELRRDPGRVTVAMYEGDGAEEEWRKHVTKYESIRHPNIMQLYGLVRAKGLWAMVFHDEMIPYEQFLNCFRKSPVLSLYIRGYCRTEFWDVRQYLREIHRLPALEDMSVWIRPSTGNVCVELVPAPQLYEDLDWWPIRTGRYMEDVSLDSPEAEAEVISNFDEDEYHRLCSLYPITQFRHLIIPTQLPLGLLGSIVRANPQDGNFVRVTEPLVFGRSKPRWENFRDEEEILANSWSRYESHRACDLELSISLSSDGVIVEKSWLAQANLTFTRLEATPHTEDYVCIWGIDFFLRCLPNTHSTCELEGYLFVCPAEDFQTRRDSYSWPECPAYWSLNPSGVPRLSTEDAKNLGFPIIHIETILKGWSWESSVYEGLRQFHRGKGWDPDSQDVALHLDYPLFELLTDITPITCRPLPPWLPYSDCQDSALCEELGHCLP